MYIAELFIGNRLTKKDTFKYKLQAKNWALSAIEYWAMKTNKPISIHITLAGDASKNDR